MPRSKTGGTRPRVLPDCMKKAVEAVTAEDEADRLSYRQACTLFGVKKTTLVDQVRKFRRQSGENAYEYKPNFDNKRVFTDEEELSLVNYVEKVAKMNYGLTKKKIRKLAYKFAVANQKKYPETWNEEEIAGVSWIRLFMKRRSLTVRKPEKLSLSRKTSFNEHTVKLFYDNLDEVHSKYGPFPPQRIFNVDETACLTVQEPPKVVVPVGFGTLSNTTSAERGSLVTMIGCINAIGNYIPPMLIFPRVHLKDHMLKDSPTGTIGAANQSGWSTEDKFVQFLDHFIDHVKPSKKERVLILMDNHETHLSTGALEKAVENGIVMLTFPPHTSNKFQPLDVSVYGPFKTFYNQYLDTWHTNNPGITFTIYHVAAAVGYAFPRAFCPRNIESGFRAPGIYPRNRNVWSEEDFLSSYVTDRPDPMTSNIPSTSSAPLQPGSSIDSASTSVPTLPGSSMNSDFNNSHISPHPGSSKDSATIISPEEIQPYPKAGERKGVKNGRAKGKSQIVTDTPNRTEIMKRKLKVGKKNSPKDEQPAVKKTKVYENVQLTTEDTPRAIKQELKTPTQKKRPVPKKQQIPACRTLFGKIQSMKDEISKEKGKEVESAKLDVCSFCTLCVKKTDKLNKCSECCRMYHEKCLPKNYDFIDEDEELFICPHCKKKITADNDFAPLSYDDLPSDEEHEDNNIISMGSLVKLVKPQA